MKLKPTTHEVVVVTPSEEVFNVVEVDSTIEEVLLVMVIEVLHNQQKVHHPMVTEDSLNQQEVQVVLHNPMVIEDLLSQQEVHLVLHSQIYRILPLV